MGEDWRCKLWLAQSPTIGTGVERGDIISGSNPFLTRILKATLPPKVHKHNLEHCQGVGLIALAAALFLSFNNPPILRENGHRIAGVPSPVRQ
jgi:hypothetical protein